MGSPLALMAGRWASQSHPLPTPWSALYITNLPTWGFFFGSCCCCYYYFVFYFFAHFFLAWFCTFLPFETLIDNLISLPKQTDSHQGLSPTSSPMSPPFFLLVLVRSEDLTITSVLQKCLNIFLRPLWILFVPRKLNKRLTGETCTAPLFSGTV